MKKIGIGILISLILSVCFATFLPVGNSLASKLNTLYAISGIMFSIGMSLIVTSSFSKIKNTQIRLRFIRAFNDVRNSYILEFIVISIIYMFNSPELEGVQCGKFHFSYPVFSAVMIIFSIIFFIVNFIELQTLNTQLDERINKNI